MKGTRPSAAIPLPARPPLRSVVTHVLGQILRPFAFVFFVPAAIDYLGGAPRAGLGFLASAALTFALGSLMVRAHARADHLGRIEALAVVSLLWLIVAMLGAVPFLLQGLSPVDGLFESMSGFTGTGSSIFGPEHWSSLSRGLLFWRSFSQWLGGLGIIVLFVAVLPALAVAGRQMFFAETSGMEDEALTPRVRFTAKRLWRLYVVLTALEIALLVGLGGLDLYGASCHAFSTLSAGGFSPYARSAAALGYLPQWIILPFMFLAGASYNLQYRSLRKPSLMLRDPEFRAYLFLVLFAGLLVAFFIAPGRSFGSALRHGFFQVVSILTATGFASEDFNLWNASALMVLGALMFIGGCAGSAGGGPKVVRMLLLLKYVAREIVFVIHPRAVRPIRLRGKALDRDTTRQIIGFLLSYFGIFAATAVVVGMVEGNLDVGITGSIATLGNIGPGFGEVGPMGGFGGLHAISKVLLTFNMWVGRLEIMAVLILLHPDVLRMLVERRRSASPH